MNEKERPVSIMGDKEREAVRALREVAVDSGLLTAFYDTDFNLLRWAAGYGFDHPAAAHALVRHLKVRRFFGLDQPELIDDDPVTTANFPLGLVGPTGIDDRFLVIECAGKIDLPGLIQSVQVTKFILHRFKFQERIQKLLNDTERRTGKQCSGIYVLDLDGLAYEPSVLPIVSGPYRLLWGHIITNYPEWISTFMIINAPWFMPILWKAIAPMLPEITRSKISIHSGPDEWKPILQKNVLPENLPAHWGGTLCDKSGDPMCRGLINIPEGKVPREMYWKPTKESPHHSKLESIILSPGQVVFRSYRIKYKKHNCETELTVYFVINKYVERTYTFAAYYSSNTELGHEPSDIAQMEDWATDFEYPGMTSTDYVKVRMPGAGLVTIKFGNENSWFRSLAVHFRVRFCDTRGQPLPFTGEDEQSNNPAKTDLASSKRSNRKS